MRRIKIAKWSKPELIVLTRGTSGEKVLFQCKLAFMSGPDGMQSACGATTACAGVCGGPCSELIGS